MGAYPIHVGAYLIHVGAYFGADMGERKKFGEYDYPVRYP